MVKTVLLAWNALANGHGALKNEFTFFELLLKWYNFFSQIKLSI